MSRTSSIVENHDFSFFKREYFILFKISDLSLSVHLLLETSADSGGVSLQALPVRAGNEASRILKFQNHRKGPYYVIRPGIIVG